MDPRQRPLDHRANRLANLLFEAARTAEATPMEMVTACLHIALATSVYAIKAETRAQHRSEVLSSIARIYDLEMARAGRIGVKR